MADGIDLVADIRLRRESLIRDAQDAVSTMQRAARQIAQAKAVIPVTADTTQFKRQVGQAVAEASRAARVNIDMWGIPQGAKSPLREAYGGFEAEVRGTMATRIRSMRTEAHQARVAAEANRRMYGSESGLEDATDTVGSAVGGAVGGAVASGKGKSLTKRVFGGLKNTSRMMKLASAALVLAETAPEVAEAIYYGMSPSGMEMTSEAKKSMYKEYLDENGQIKRDQDVTKIGETKAAKAVEKAQEAVRGLPLIGSAAEKLGGKIYKFFSATKNWVTGGDFTSDAKMAEKTMADVARQEQHTELLKQQLEFRKRLVKALEKQTKESERNAFLAGAPEAVKIAAGFQTQREELYTELLKPEYRDKQGRLTQNAMEYRDARLREIAANEAEAGRSRGRTWDAMRSESRVSGLRSSGFNDAAAAAEFEEKLRVRYEELKRQDPALAFMFEREVMPTARQAFYGQQARGQWAGQRSSADRIAGMRGDASSALLRAAGAVYQADLEDFNRSIDARTKALRDQAEAESDAEKKRQLQAEAAVSEETGRIQKVAFAKERALTAMETLAEMSAQAEVSRLRAAERSYEADEKAWSSAWDRKLKKLRDASNASNGEAKKMALAELQAAEGVKAAEAAERETQKRREIGRLQLGTAQINAELGGQGALGSVLALREDIAEQQRQAGNDPSRQAAVRQNAIARLRQFVKGMQGEARLTTPEGYYNDLQLGILRGASNGNGEAIKEAQEMIERLQGGKNVDSRLGIAGVKLQAAADKLSAALDGKKTLAVIRDN